MTPQEFIKTIAPAAQKSAATTKIPASFVVAEAALETGWGAHVVGMNLFGVKADPSWKGAFTTKRTREVVNGKTIFIDAKFRLYTDWLGSISDHATFLLVNKRYRPCFSCTDVRGFTQAVARAGYATDPDYAKKILAIIDKHDLTKLDA